MADEIVQQLGFDVAQALDALARLDSALKGIEGSLAGFGTALAAWNTKGAAATSVLRDMATAAQKAATAMASLATPVAPTAAAPISQLWLPSGVQSTAQQTAASMTAIGTAAQGAGQAATTAMNQAAAATSKATGHAQGLTMSWQTMGRVIVTQAIVRAISMLRDMLAEAYQSAMEFAKQINEIGAINPERNLQQIAADIRQLSDNMNQPLSRVAEAQYQTISDQFVSTADRANILSAANLLAKTSNQDLADSAMLLTGALNAYNESSETAGLRAAQFFKTVELGRIRMGELGVGMGRVQALAHELGLSMEELQAGFIAITIGGVKPAEAATQLRGVMSALLKPSDDMKVALRRLGVDSGETAIATWGLAGTLERLWEVSGRTATGMSQLFRNIRGDIGALRLMGEGAQKYAEGLAAVNAIDQSKLRDKFKIIMATDAEKLTTELNKIKNFFTVDFGASLVSGLRDAVGWLGGADGIVPVLRAISHQAGPVALSVGIVGAAMLGLSIHAKMAALQLGSLTPLLMLLAGIQMAKAGGEMIGSWMYEYAARENKLAREELAKNLARREEMAAAEIRVRERSNQEAVKVVRQSAADANVAYLQDVENFEIAEKIKTKIVEQAFDRIMATRQKLTQELFAASETAAKKASELTQQIGEIQQRILDRNVTTTAKRFDPAHQVAIYTEQARQLSRVAAQMQGAAKDSNEEKLADAAWKRVDAYAALAEGAAKQTGNLSDQRRIENLLLEIDNKRIGASQQQIMTQQQVARETGIRAREAEEHTAKLERQRASIEQKLKATAKDAAGDIVFKGKEEYLKDLAEVETELARYNSDLKKYNKEDFARPFLGDPRAFEAMRREAERSLASMDVKTIEAAPGAFRGMFEELQASAESMRLKVPIIAEIEGTLGMDLIKDGYSAILDAYEARLNAIHTAEAEYKKNLASQMDVGGAYTVGRGEAEKTLERVWQKNIVNFSWEKSADEARLGVGDLLRLFDEIHSKTEITSDDFKALGDAIDGIDWADFKANAPMGTEAKLSESLMTVVEALRKQQELQQAQKAQAPSSPVETEKVNAINRRIEALQREKEAALKAAGASGQGQDAAKGVRAALQDTSQIDMSGLTGQIMSAVGAMQQLALAAYSVPSVGVNAAAGGRIYLAGGGMSRGTDVIPAMLTPGEIVINAESARRFSTQLTAMNAGVQPVFRSDGGSVTNIGDINVSVTGGGSSRQTARSIASELRRELRRGTSTL